MQYFVTAVVVSYNRADLLAECLAAMDAQERRPDRLVIVDNASTDRAPRVARDFAARTAIDTDVVALRVNTGGAGGFAAGMALALDSDVPHGDIPYIWLMDDDTVPSPGALAELLRAADACAAQNHCLPAALGSKAVWTDGREHLMNKPRPRPRLAKGERGLAAFPDAYQVRSLSFVSCLVNADAARALGRLPRAAYFLWNDDYEYTTALLRDHIGYYVPASVVTHKTKVFGSSDADPGPRFYNEVRNKVWMWRFSRRNLTLGEKLTYWPRAVRRWVLTWFRSDDPATIDDCFLRGWRDGWHERPQDTIDLLRWAGLDVPASTPGMPGWE
ncbi:MAG: glycosyltransferase [Bifidobacterium sp.]|nr:glycosyltransferase [Bifidobacterium sp.]